MIEQIKQEATIQPIIVPGHLRASTLPKRFPGMFLVYESLVYSYMEKFSSDYSGGYWEFVELSNGGFYMSLKSNSRVYLEIDTNGFEDEMTADAASVVINLFVQCHLAHQHDELDSLIDMYYALRNYACEHTEASKILKAID